MSYEDRSTEPVQVEVTGRQFRYDGEEYRTGETLEVPEWQLEGYQGRITRVDDPDNDDDVATEPETEPAAADDDESDDGDAAPDAEDEVALEEIDPHPQDLTVPELADRVEGVEDVATLQAIKQLEENAGDDTRSTAIDAINDRIGDLEG